MAVRRATAPGQACEPVKWSEKLIAAAMAMQTFQRRMLVVPNCSATGYECDLLVVAGDLRIVDVEIKISRADLKADAKKDKWWHRKFIGREDYTDDHGRRLGRFLYDSTPRQHPVKVWKHYYAMPADIWDDSLIDCLPSADSGVILLSVDRRGRITAYVHRRAKPSRKAEKLTAVEVANIARLANLRMWNAIQQAANDNGAQS